MSVENDVIDQFCHTKNDFAVRKTELSGRDNISEVSATIGRF